MIQKPIRRQLGGLLEGARFLEEMRRTGHNFQSLLTGEFRECGPVQFQDVIIESTHDEKRRRAHVSECRPSEVGSTTARHDRADLSLLPRRGDQRGRRTRARPEVA